MNDLLEEICRVAEQAVEMADDQGSAGLDYSEGSLDTVEELLAEFAAYELTEEQVRRLSEDFGCYILEVARRAFGGQYCWHEQRDQPVLVAGEPEFHVALLAWDHVEGRLKGDPSYRIPFFYQGFAARVRQAEPGTHVLYV